MGIQLIKRALNITNYNEVIKKFDNVYQYLALREFMLKKESIREVANNLLDFKNWYQLRALQILIGNHIYLIPVIGSLNRINNEFQVQALNYAMSSKIDINHYMKEILNGLLEVNNQFQVNAIRFVVGN